LFRIRLIVLYNYTIFHVQQSRDTVNNNKTCCQPFSSKNAKHRNFHSQTENKNVEPNKKHVRVQ